MEKVPPTVFASVLSSLSIMVYGIMINIRPILIVLTYYLTANHSLLKNSNKTL